MTVLDFDLSDIDDLPPVDFDPGVGLQTLLKQPPSMAKKCRCCDLPVYADRAVYCSPKSTCRSRYHRHPERYQQQNATGVASVAGLTPEMVRLIIREEIAAAGGGSSRATLSPDRQLSADLNRLENLIENIEIRKDESGAARSSQNFRNCLMALQSGTGAWANSGA